MAEGVVNEWVKRNLRRIGWVTDEAKRAEGIAVVDAASGLIQAGLPEQHVIESAREQLNNRKLPGTGPLSGPKPARKTSQD